MYDNLFSELKPSHRAGSCKRSRSRPRIGGTGMRREIECQVLMASTRQPAPSRRTRCADIVDISGRGFIGIVAGWTGALLVILVISALIRFFG
jgi:hypothetical protein